MKLQCRLKALLELVAALAVTDAVAVGARAQAGRPDAVSDAHNQILAVLKAK